MDVGRGESYAYTFQITAYRRGGNSAPQFAVDDAPGTYRLAWGI